MIEEHGSASDEPEEGWVTGQQLWSQPLITIALCRYSGQPLEEDESCLAREYKQHPDEDCFEHFYSVTGIDAGLVDIAEPILIAEVPVREVRYGPDGATGVSL